MNFFKKYQSFSQILPDFQAERGLFLGEKTFNSEKGVLQRFSEWLDENNLGNKPLRSITNRDIGRFSTMIAKSLDKPTCQKYMGSIEMVWEYAKKIGEFPGKDLPFNMVVIPGKKGDFSPALIPKEVFEEMVNAMKNEDSSLYVAAMILYYAFIRPGRELRNLTTDRYDFDQRLIRD